MTSSNFVFLIDGNKQPTRLVQFSNSLKIINNIKFASVYWAKLGVGLSVV